MITIYTDGSSKGNPGPGGWSAIVLADQKVVELGGREEMTTNNRMELMAAIKSLEFTSKLGSQEANQANKATIYTDSEYVMKGITLWIHGWMQKGWRTAAKKPVLNQDLWQELWSLVEGKEVEWQYVRGHSGHNLNERCDVIATTFADGVKPDLYEGPRNSYLHM